MERSPIDGEDDGAQDFRVSASYINPTSPSPSKLPLASINQSKALVLIEGNYVGITIKMYLKTAARRLQGHTAK